MFDILCLSNIIGYVYFYDDRVSLVIALNIHDIEDRRQLGIIDNHAPFVKVDDHFLLLRYYFRDDVPRWRLDGYAHISKTGMSQEMMVVYANAFDRYKFPHILVEKACKSVKHVVGQYSSYYYGHEHGKINDRRGRCIYNIEDDDCVGKEYFSEDDTIRFINMTPHDEYIMPHDKYLIRTRSRDHLGDLMYTFNAGRNIVTAMLDKWPTLGVGGR